MVELAEIFRRYGPAYRARFGPHMLPSHHEAMRAIEQCRTPALGGQVYECPDCGESRYLYHSRRNRHCPKCQNGNAQEWLAAQRDLLLPVPYFLLTFTLPAELRTPARSHQRLFYDLLFRTPAEAAQYLVYAFRRRTTGPGRSSAHPSASSGQALGTQPRLSPPRALPRPCRWRGQ